MQSKKNIDKTIDEWKNVYNPSKSNYDPILDAIWLKGENVPFIAFTTTLQCIENVTSRLKIIEILSNYFHSVISLSSEDLNKSVFLCLNGLGIGESLIIKALILATGKNADQMKADLNMKVDLGLVAEKSLVNVLFSPKKLSVDHVFIKIKDIAKLSCNAEKIEIVKSMLLRCRDNEARYLVSLLTGKLKIGLAEHSLIVALARAVVIHKNPDLNQNTDKFKKKSSAAALTLKSVYSEYPNFESIIPIMLNEGIDALSNHCKLCPSIPFKPMLAHPSKTVDEVLKRYAKAKFTCEFKYDGERMQIHLSNDGRLHLFSRNQENNTSKYPDIVTRIPSIVKKNVKSFILDCEAVAWDNSNKKILPFRMLSTRKRKSVLDSKIKINLCLFAFDLVYLNGQSLLSEPLSKRRDFLMTHFKTHEGLFVFVESKDVESVEEIKEFLEKSIKNHCEGLMIKTLDIDASYEIAKRSHKWLKLKKNYLDGVGDTLDLVVIGGYYGKGKRNGFYIGYLLACYDEDNEEFQSICKLGSGFKDKEVEDLARFLSGHILQSPKKYYNFDKSLKPDVWFDAVQVWEIKCTDLSLSTVYRAANGLVDGNKGISLRFPKFLSIREDKSVVNATSASQVAELYKNQIKLLR